MHRTTKRRRAPPDDWLDQVAPGRGWHRFERIDPVLLPRPPQEPESRPQRHPNEEDSPCQGDPT